MTVMRQLLTQRMVRKGYARLRYARPAGITCGVLKKPFSVRRMESGLVALLLAVAMASASDDVHAWGQTGHRVIAEIAQARLSPAAKEGVQAIIGRETLSRISTWPDELRSDPEDRYKHTFAWHVMDIDAARPNLGYDYHYRHRPLLDRRLAQAGVRLALTLDRVFR